jgi:AraC-like DNA-binding protein
MLPNLERVEANLNHSFHINHLKVDHFPSLRHFHPEVEILLVIKGHGTRYVGDSIEPFEPGDLVMIGPNVSHEWCSDRHSTGSGSEAIYILFNTAIMGSEFWNLPESKIILRIIGQSERGIRLTGQTRDEVAGLMGRIDASSGFTRITLLLTILELIAFTGEYQYLASPVIQNTVNDSDAERINKVCRYVLDNYQQEISLATAASLANLSKPAFCRYFRKRSNKTFIRFLNEIRVGQACRLLMDEKHSIAEICFISGYNNISYFIRQFRTITGFTPLAYRRRFSDKP